MKKTNIYYVISIISLAFMMFVLLRTLQVRGWFEAHRVKSPTEYLLQDLPGHYQMIQDGAPNRVIMVSNYLDESETGWLVASEDSIPFLFMKLSDFEDEQILVELFQLDSVNHKQRFEGCELLITENAGVKTGGTLGEFCGLKGDPGVYIDLAVRVDELGISLQIQFKNFDDQSLVKRKTYLLERQVTHDE